MHPDSPTTGDPSAPPTGGAAHERVADYAVALDVLDALKSAAATDSKPLIAALHARDDVAHALPGDEGLSGDTLIQIDGLDARLRTLIPQWIRSGTRLEQWRKALNPSPEAWWWRLDEPEPHPLWIVLTAICAALSVSLATEISRRFLAGGADFLSVFSTLSSATLPLLAGSSLTQAGRDALKRLLLRLKVAPRRHAGLMAGLSVAVFLALLGFWSVLPAISARYNAAGLRLQQAHQVTRAVEYYKRAISLNHDNATAQYDLATAYEDVLDYNQAITVYQAALQADDKHYAAYNNLARLYLLRANPVDDGNALKLLDTAAKLNPTDAIVRYSLSKNRGWAELGLQLYGQAENDLRQALEVRPDGAAAYCLLGQLLSAVDRGDEAVAAWEACLGYAAGDFVESSWLAQAREALNNGGDTK